MGNDLKDYPSRLLIDLQEGHCNLKCAMCAAHGVDGERDFPRGVMPMERLLTVLDEVADSKPLIHPNLWSEPLLYPHFREAITAMKERELAVNVNSNGILLDSDLAKFIVEIGLDSLLISIDAHSPGTLKKMRGIDDLGKIHQAVFNVLEARGDALTPRLGVSFTYNQNNMAEKDDFVDFWLKHVDLVRIGREYENGKWQRDVGMPEARLPCDSLYHTMAVHHNGDVSYCCLDIKSETFLGNIFEDGVKNVWLGEKFQRIRKHHEENRYDLTPFCQNCNVWLNYDYSEKETETLLIRSCPGITYYNRKDRLPSWKKDIQAHHG